MNVVSQYISVKRISDEIDFTCKPASKIRMAALVASITKKQAEEIAKQKMNDLNAIDLEQAVKIIAGSARSMGIEVKE